MGRERQGLEMIARPLGEVLSSEGVETMDPLGTRFDPHQHYARQIRAVAAERDGRVVEVLRKGYRHQRRLLRSADVVVGRIFQRAISQFFKRLSGLRQDRGKAYCLHRKPLKNIAGMFGG